MLQQVLDQSSTLVRRGRDGLGGAESSLQTPKAGAQGTLRVVETAGSETQGDGDAMGTRAHPPRQPCAARARVLGAQPEPAAAMCHARPPGHVGAELAADDQGRAFFDARDGRQVDAGHPIQGGPGLKPGGVALCVATGLGGQGLARTVITTGRQRRLDLLVASGALRVLDRIQLDGLASGKQMLGTPMALQGHGPLVRIVVTVWVTQWCQALWMALAREDGFEEGHPGHARDVTEHLGALAVHLVQGLVHVLHRVRGIGQPHLAVAHIAAPHASLVSGTASPGEQPIGVQAWQPLAVEPIGCRAPRDTRGLARIDEEDLPAAGLEQFAQGHPVDPGGFHGDSGDTTVEEPGSQGVESGSAGAETTHGLGGASRRHGAPVLGFADVKASGLGVADLEGFGEHGGLREQRRRGWWTRGTAIVLVGCHRSLLPQGTAPRTAVGAGVTEQRAVSQTGSGRGLSPVLWSPTPETNLTNGPRAPMPGRSRRPTGCPAG